MSYCPRLVARTRWIIQRGLALWPELAIIVAVAVAFEPTLAGSAHLPYDAELFHYPLLRTVQEQLSSGNLPGWDPYSYGGMPLLANAQSAWLYPPHLILDGILTVIGAPLTEHALDVLAVMHVAVAGIGTAAVARARRLGRAAAAFAGMFVVLNGATLAQAQHLGMTETLAWVPLAILVIDRMSEKGLNSGRIVALGALFALMISAGFLPLVSACAALLVGVAVSQRRRRLRAFGGVVAGMALGVAMAGAVLLPIVALLKVFPMLEAHGSLPTTGLVTTVFPNAFGQWGASLAEFTGMELTNSYFYVGAGVLVLLPLALTSGRRVIGEALLVAALLLATFGAPGTHIATALQSIPSVGLLWRPEDVIYVAMVPLALLLARGLARAPSARQLALVALVVIGVAVIPFSAGHVHGLRLLAKAPRRTLLALALIGLCVLLANVARTRLHRPRLVAATLGIAAIIAGADLASAAIHRYFVNAPGPATNAGTNQIGDPSAILSVLRQRLSPTGRIAADIDTLPAQWAGFSSVWHLSDANGFQPQFSKYQLARVTATGVDFEGHNRTFPIVAGIRSYLQELNVEYAVVYAGSDRLAGVRGYTPVFQDAIYHVYRVDGPESRAYAIRPDCLRDVGSFDLSACRTGPPVSTTLTGLSSRRLLIASPVDHASQLVIGELWYPGWHAATPSRSLPVRRVGQMAVVTVPAGTTQVQISYEVPGLLAGGLLSILAIGGSLLWMRPLRLWRWPSRRPSV